jgi:replicative DNA helicase
MRETIQKGWYSKMMIEGDAERYVLGAMLMNNGLILDVQKELKPDDFTSDANRRIYDAIIKLNAKNVHADIQTVWLEVKDTISPGYVATLTDIETASTWKHNTEKVKSAALRRIYTGLAANLLEACKKDIDNGFEITRIVSEISGVHDRSARRGSRNLAEVCGNVINRIEEAKNNKNKGLRGIDTGYDALNRITDGFYPEYILLAARTGKGKSAIALNMAYNMILRGKKPAYFSLEMTAEECVERMLSTGTDIGTRQFSYGNIQNDQYKTIVDSMAKIFDSGIMFDDIMGQNIFEIEAKIKAFVRVEKCDAIFIDHFALIQSTEIRIPRTEQCSMISKRIMKLVKELRVPIIVVCQLNRIAEEDPPKVSHLAESGYLEQDAQLIILMDRDRSAEEGKDYIETKLYIDKNRHGPSGVVELDFYPDIVTFKASDRNPVDTRFPKKEKKDGKK